jgi:hypothetical protein
VRIIIYRGRERRAQGSEDRRVHHERSGFRKKDISLIERMMFAHTSVILIIYIFINQRDGGNGDFSRNIYSRENPISQSREYR